MDLLGHYALVFCRVRLPFILFEVSLDRLLVVLRLRTIHMKKPIKRKRRAPVRRVGRRVDTSELSRKMSRSYASSRSYLRYPTRREQPVYYIVQGSTPKAQTFDEQVSAKPTAPSSAMDVDTGAPHPGAAAEAAGPQFDVSGYPTSGKAPPPVLKKPLNIKQRKKGMDAYMELLTARKGRGGGGEESLAKRRRA